MTPTEYNVIVINIVALALFCGLVIKFMRRLKKVEDQLKVLAKETHKLDVQNMVTCQRLEDAIFRQPKKFKEDRRPLTDAEKKSILEQMKMTAGKLARPDTMDESKDYCG